MALLSLSQRDPKWSTIPLGTSKTTTIGSHGCTITCLAMLFGTTPDVVNKELLRVGGYAQTNLVVWSKISDAFPGSEFITRSHTYNNNQVKVSIEKYGGCLVEVGASRIGAPTHWVLYIGNGRMIDPWTGVEKATSYYPVKGYAVIKPPETMPETALEACLKQHADLINQLEAEKRKTEALQEQLRDKELENDTLRGEVAEKASALKTVREELSQFIESLATKLTTIADKSEIIGAVDRLISGESDYIKKVRNLEKAYALLEDEKRIEIEGLKKSIEELKTANEQQAKHIGMLETRLSNLETGEVQTRSFFSVVKDILERLKWK